MSQSTTENMGVIVAAVDVSPAADEVIAAAVSLATKLGDAELHLVHVVPPPAFPSGPAIPPMPSIVDDALAFLHRMRAVAGGMYTGPITVHLGTGDAHDEIVSFATALGADVIVAGAPARSGLARWLHGSVSRRLAYEAPCAVYLARAKASTQRAANDVAPVPEIEPPCPACVAARDASAGTQQWCAFHGRPRPHAHLHYSIPPSFGVGSMFMRPD